MSRRPVVKYIAFDALPASAAQTQVVPTNVENTDSCSYHVKFSAPASGTFTVQAKNADLRPDQASIAWYDLNFGSPLTITAETDVQIVLNEMPFKEMRLVWTPSSASGTVSAYLLMKAKGA
jgi:hypothetical protein